CRDFTYGYTELIVNRRLNGFDISCFIIPDGNFCLRICTAVQDGDRSLIAVIYLIERLYFNSKFLISHYRPGTNLQLRRNITDSIALLPPRSQAVPKAEENHYKDPHYFFLKITST